MNDQWKNMLDALPITIESFPEFAVNTRYDITGCVQCHGKMGDGWQWSTKEPMFKVVQERFSDHCYCKDEGVCDKWWVNCPVCEISFDHTGCAW